ncbi:MAG: hypothetical protein KJ566_00250 [Nanoarchaeota archaeon]|nr:hypothetical protein [Nanoarchaeota archaeon]
MTENSKINTIKKKSSLKEIAENISANFLPFMGIALATSALIGFPLMKKFCSDPAYRNAKQLKGIVVKENFRETFTSALLEGSTSHGHYYIAIELNDGKKYNFYYEEDAAIRMDTKYDVGDEIKWKEGFKPEYKQGFLMPGDEY